MSLKIIVQLIVVVVTLSNFTSCDSRGTANQSLARDRISVPEPDFSGVNEEQFKESAKILARLDRIFAIKPEMALEIGRKRLNVSPENAKSLTLCNGGISWRVIDPEKRKEVWIAKDRGTVYSPPRDLRRNVFDEPKGGPVNQVDAFEIAKKHFIAYGRRTFNSDETILSGELPSVCDLIDSWRVYFFNVGLGDLKTPQDIANLSNDHPPDYIIDKQTGEITYFSKF